MSATLERIEKGLRGADELVFEVSPLTVDPGNFLIYRPQDASRRAVLVFANDSDLVAFKTMLTTILAKTTRATSFSKAGAP